MGYGRTTPAHSKIRGSLAPALLPNGESWTTIGVSPNIIDASFQALMDSVIYKLVKSGAPA